MAQQKIRLTFFILVMVLIAQVMLFIFISSSTYVQQLLHTQASQGFVGGVLGALFIATARALYTEILNYKVLQSINFQISKIEERYKSLLNTIDEQIEQQEKRLFTTGNEKNDDFNQHLQELSKEILSKLHRQRFQITEEMIDSIRSFSQKENFSSDF